MPVWPAAVSNWLSKTTQVAPAARVPSEDNPTPGFTVELVVNVNGVPAPPVAVVGKNLKVMVPLEGVAPPLPAPNGSAVVFAIVIPVSNTPITTVFGMRNVVLDV